MGWGYGVVKGREVGYSVEATCDQEGCKAAIDRGLAYLCGQMHGQDDGDGCGKYFCSEHGSFGGPCTHGENAERPVPAENEPRWGGQF